MAKSGVAVSGGVGVSWLLIIGVIVGVIWYRKKH